MVRATQDITIWDEDNDNAVTIDNDHDLHSKAKIWDGTDEVTITNNRLDVNNIFDGRVDPAGTPIHQLGGITQAATLVSYTVPAGNIFYIYSWGFSSENAQSRIELQINTTARDRMLQRKENQHDSGQRGLNNVRYTIPIIATAGQTVRLQRVAGSDTNRNRTGFFEGVLYAI
jgi:hypothetical protein